MFGALQLGLSLTRGQGGGSLAASLLAGQATGFAVSGQDVSAVVKGHTTNYNGSANDLLTYASPSAKWVYNKAGLLYASSGQLPRDYDPATNEALGLLIESAFTNYAGYPSEDFSTAWSRDNSGATSPVVTANYANAPTGAQTADRVVFDKTGGTFSRLQRVISAPAGAAAVLSIWGRTTGAGPSNVGLRVGTNAGVNRGFTSSYQRLWTTVADGGAAPSPQILLWDSIVGNDETADLVLWGANVGIGTFPTSYVPCTDVATDVIRNADAISLPISDIPWAAGGNVVTISGRTALGSGTQVFFQADDGSENNRVRIVRDASNNLRCIVTDGGVEQCNLDLGSVANETDFAVSFGFQADDFAASLNGGTSVTDTGGTLPTVTTLRLGSSFTGEHCCGWLRSLSVVPA